tara:strand:+ start:463 stop:1095 length:633 start_codon:yes stop_codon:yes gene_type:complete
MIAKLGVLGGMFDPVHNGHIDAARYAKELLSLDLVNLIPCNVPNHKVQSYAPAEDRLAMIKLAVRDESGIEVDDIELQRPSVSYSVETLKTIKAQKLAHNITFILGMDSFNSITDWFNWEELFALCSFLVLGRSGLSVDKKIAEKVQLKTRLAQSIPEFFREATGKVFIASNFNIDLSSTSVRAMLGANLGIEGCLKREIFEYIKDKNLY